MFALIDCNNFYVSCERAFNPRLENKAVVVLSNNDGCIISRSNEAKKLGIPMGAPFYQWKRFCLQHDVHVFSSNYELYGDMSQRVMDLLREFNSGMEIYSIDEAFYKFNEMVPPLALKKLREKIKNSTGIPISIGAGSTKTLAKIANQLAKNMSGDGTYILHAKDPALSSFPAEKIWGIGHQLAVRLKKLGIETAQQLKQTDPKFLRLHFSVSMEKIVQELNGIPCLQLSQPEQRKQIISSRSFGKPITELAELEEAVSYYVNLAAQKLRQQHCLASALYVFLQTNIFNEKTPQYGNAVMFPFPAPVSDTRDFIRIAKKCVRHLYKKGYQYHKAGIMLVDISSEKQRQLDMLMPVIHEKSEKLMQVVDKINAGLGRDTIFFAAEGIEKKWVIKCDRRSPRYTTRWHELPQVF